MQKKMCTGMSPAELFMITTITTKKMETKCPLVVTYGILIMVYLYTLGYHVATKDIGQRCLSINMEK